MADILISKFTTQIPRVGATPATPGFAESEGQDPTAPSGTPQVYTPVTIGSPANGLSISGTQVLTIGLASTSATGALSSTDWNTFNGKLNLTSPITGYTVGANTALADTDTILQAFGKVQGQINARVSGSGISTRIAYWNATGSITSDSDLVWLDSVNDLRITGSSSTTGLLSLYNSTNLRGQLGSGAGEFFISASGGFTPIIFRTSGTVNRWSILSNGVFQAEGSQSITTTSNGNLSLTPNGTGLVMIGSGTPTNLLDVNGTARIRTISNLGSAATSVLVPSATGVVSLRTLAELASDMGNAWTSVGSGNIFRNSRISVGHTGDPVESIDLGTAGWLRTSNGASAVGGVLFPNGSNAASRSWAIGSDLGSAFGQFAIRRSDTQTGSAKTGTISLIIDSLGSVGINGTPFSFGNITYLDVYGRSTDASGSLRLLSSNSSVGWQAFTLSSVFTTNTTGSIPWVFGTNSVERMRITAGGNVLVGTATDAGYAFLVSSSLGSAFSGGITLIDTSNANIVLGTTTGTRIGTATNQRLAFWNKTPIVQPTNAIGAGAFVANTSGIANDTATYGGYTMGQIAQALINVGILA